MEKAWRGGALQAFQRGTSSQKIESVEARICRVCCGVSEASRPYTSNDNPYSESQFKTLKYRPEFSERFGSIEDSRHFFRNCP